MTASFLVFPTFLIFFVCSSFIYALPYTTFLLSTHLQANRPPIFFSTFLLLSEETVCFLSFSLFFFFTLYEPGVSSLDPFLFSVMAAHVAMGYGLLYPLFILPTSFRILLLYDLIISIIIPIGIPNDSLPA